MTLSNIVKYYSVVDPCLPTSLLWRDSDQPADQMDMGELQKGVSQERDVLYFNKNNNKKPFRVPRKAIMGQARRCTYWVLKNLRRPHLAQVHLLSCARQCGGWWKCDSFLLQVKSLHSGGDSAGISITWSPSAIPLGGSSDLLPPF